ncbi:MAG: glycogen synthase [Chitinivibrionales bacterium]|nr:glycogen synthase [Chitinivibrionales bacterium]
MNILIATSEFAPYAKTGGLADSVAALAQNLHQAGHEVRVVLPLYGQIKHSGITLDTTLNSMCVRMGVGEEWCAVRMLRTPGGVTVYLIDHELYFGRNGLYHDDSYNDYLDNLKRFGFFSRAVLQCALDTQFKPDVVQVNDWQTALVAAYIKTWFWNNPLLGSAASVLTIHNIAFQGVYPAPEYRYLGFRDDQFISDIFEDYGNVNCLKAGIVLADAVNTVSYTHCQELLEPFGGFGLTPYLRNKGPLFWGILNGVDYSVWSPENDPLIKAHYSSLNPAGKKKCKRYLQEKFLLEPDPDCALIGSIGRLSHQKGHALIRAILEKVLREMKVQFVILGKGDPELESYYGTLPGRYPGKVASFIGFNDSHAHAIEAGSDFFLMPSLHEPCGLNQMYSLRYGTLPIVRAVGGLNDSVDNYNEYTGEGTGFKFYDPTPQALHNTIGWAVSTYYDRPHHIKQLMRQAMEKDFSWHRSIEYYQVLFTKALEAKQSYDQQCKKGLLAVA